MDHLNRPSMANAPLLIYDLLPKPNNNRDILLIHKPRVHILPLMLRIHQLNLKPPSLAPSLRRSEVKETHIKQTVKRRNQLRNLQCHKIPPQTDSRPSPKHKVSRLPHRPHPRREFLGALPLLLKPPLRSECLNVVAENARVAAYHVRIGAHNSPPPPGTKRPSGRVNPESGTTRSSIIATPGLIRSDSRITASRYGRSRMSFH